MYRPEIAPVALSLVAIASGAVAGHAVADSHLTAPAETIDRVIDSRQQAESYQTPAKLLPEGALSVAVEMQHSNRDWDNIKKSNYKKKTCMTNSVALFDTPQWVCDETQNNPGLRKWAKVNLVLWSMSPTLAYDLEELPSKPNLKFIWSCQKEAINMQKNENMKYFYIATGSASCRYVFYRKSRTGAGDASRCLKDTYDAGPWAKDRPTTC